LIKEHKDISIEGGGDVINYLGMRFMFNKSDKSVSIDQKGYVEDLLKIYNTGRPLFPPLFLANEKKIFFGVSRSSYFVVIVLSSMNIVKHKGNQKLLYF